MTAPAVVSDALDGLARARLRPGVGVTPLRAGLHLRGWRSSVTLEGSPALPALWQLLAEVLAGGDHAALTDRAPVGSPLRAALNTLVGHLREHDLLTGPAEDAPAWLRVGAADPVAAAADLAAARPQLRTTDPASPLARAAAQALVRAGAAPATVAAPTADGLVLLTAGPGSATAVGVAATPAGGFVTAPGTPAQVAADAEALAARLGLVPTAADEASPTPAALTALLAGAAAHRLLCALTGLPDPATEGEDHHVLAGLPAVLVVDAAPLRSSWRSWPAPRLPGPDTSAPLDPPDTLARALHRLAALTDGRVGVLPAPEPGTLSQLPVARARCPVPGGTLLAAAVRTDLARLDALCRGAELRLDTAESTTAVGATPDHALGRALRRAATAVAAGGTPLPVRSWAGHPQAEHWWRTLTAELGRPAELGVTRLAPGGHTATVRVPGRPPVTAVEATAGDAVAFAALGAVAQAVSAELTFRHLSLPSGAGAALVAAGLELTAWEDEGWTTGWLTGIAAREPALLAGLCELTGLTVRPADPAPALAEALRACGFTVLAVRPTTNGATR
ncbi:hypothetical protein C7C46_13990 [Streptomyces tateyamensis]|uniref:Uncharacterized protein n=1 Tax=Streptomyces tateyamensis TaxID=565073 RepID=A0A2V4P4S2_9ACTN|nr:hypothetical protein [Streptomyces tateyamensis]PYC79473.1 hypothetical protein C7C46_13990 [Streptomyces tateyamensis]